MAPQLLKADQQKLNEGRAIGTVQFSTDRHTDKFIRICFEMKFLATILAVLVIQRVDAVEEEGDVNIIIEQNVFQPDVDECLEKIDACAENELCINMPGTYRCDCLDGFEKVKGICKDVDECSENIDTCNDTNEVCVNRVGSFSCVCSDGFEKLEDICEDVDECLEKIDSCADNEFCENMPGTYRCTCADGFEKVTGICKDIDECIEMCGIHGVCVNSPSSFTCTCNEGFEEVEGICEDIDECIEMCGIHGVCVNSPGSFTCTCNEGFEEVEGICEDIDECKDNTKLCQEYNEMCANNIGSYACPCIEGFYKITYLCTKCVSPSFQLDDFGCIQVQPNLEMTWAGAKDTCQTYGGKLIEGIKNEHLEPIINAFKTQLDGKNPWVGMKDSRWVISQIDVAKDDEVWADGEPSLENDVCGTFNMDANNPGLTDAPCTNTDYFLCQFLP